jgi:hypothetical protein
MSLSPEIARLTVIANCGYGTNGVRDATAQIYGEMTVSPGSLGGVEVTCYGMGGCSMSANRDPYASDTTYTGSANFRAVRFAREVDYVQISNSIRTPPPIRPPGEVIQCGGIGPYEDCSPIVINFEGGYELTGVNDPVLFDIKGTGAPVLIGWTAAGSDEAFLWLDRNGNGAVDGGSELFGTATRLINGDRASNGFEALRELDSNSDSLIDVRDATWGALGLWRMGITMGRRRSVSYQWSRRVESSH